MKHLIKIRFSDGIEEIHECDYFIMNKTEDYIDLYDNNSDEPFISFNFDGITDINIVNIPREFLLKMKNKIKNTHNI